MSHERRGPQKCLLWLQNKGRLKIYMVKGINNDPQVSEPGIVAFLGKIIRKSERGIG